MSKNIFNDPKLDLTPEQKRVEDKVIALVGCVFVLVMLLVL